MKKILILILILINFNCSSSDDSIELNEGIIFGEVYGLCGGDCRNLFLLTDSSLYQDLNKDTHYGSWENTSFKKQPLSSETFETAKTLLSIPDNLFELENTFEDQQLYSDIDYYIHIKKEGKTHTLIFDKPHDKAGPDSKLYLEKLIDIYSKLPNE